MAAASPAQTFAFITHSPATLPNNLPPDVDNERLARRRRRRTSQHDQAILESEYAKNDRPDRIARREIAKKVELGEKEIQIWFQNRRQTNRRKSKPLLPHELIPHNSDKTLELSSDLFTSSPDKTQHQEDDDTIQLHHSSSRASSPCPESYVSIKVEPGVQDVTADTIMSDSTEPDLDLSSDSIQPSSSPLDLVQLPRKTSPIQFLLNPTTGAILTSFSSSQATIADEPFISQADQSDFDINQDSADFQSDDTSLNSRRKLSVNQQPKLLKRSSSLVRLSMSLDGKATVILEDESATTKSSQTSAVLDSPQSSFNESAHTPPKRRTLNAKIWESCCDIQSSIPIEPVAEDSPRKALKVIRARKVVAAAKAAANARKTYDTPGPQVKMSPKKKSILTPKSTNATIPTKMLHSTKLYKSETILREKTVTRKIITSTQRSGGGPKKVTTPSPPLSAVKNRNRSPLKTLEMSLSTKKEIESFTIYQSSDEGDSEKENWDPVMGKGKKTQQMPAGVKKNGRNVLGDLGEERIPQPNELEVIENLMSLREGLWR